jgi:hypothetical protein
VKRHSHGLSGIAPGTHPLIKMTTLFSQKSLEEEDDE